MKTWIKLLVVVAAVALAAADEVKGQNCNIDQPGTTRRCAFSSAMGKFGVCYQGIFSEETKANLKTAKSLADYQGFARTFCTHAPQVAACIATAKASFETFHNKNVSSPVLGLADLVEDLLPGVCENEGDRLARLIHASMMMVKSPRDSLVPLRRCLTKASSFYHFVEEELDLDIVSWMYLMYKNVPMFRPCAKYVVDEEYKQVFGWLVDEILEKLKCVHPEENTLVLCSDIDVSKVTTSSICDSTPLNVPNLYDYLEGKTIEYVTFYFKHDSERNNSISPEAFEELEEEKRSLCEYNKNVPYFLLKHSGFAEVCLSQEDNKQFQLFTQSIEDLTERSCAEEGAWMATVVYEICQQTPENGHGFTDCFKAGAEARKSHQGHAVSSKNMRFYHEMAAFKQCAVDKLHTNSELAKSMDNMMNEFLKNMKCVKPEDGTAVLCATIHE